MSHQKFTRQWTRTLLGLLPLTFTIIPHAHCRSFPALFKPILEQHTGHFSVLMWAAWVKYITSNIQIPATADWAIIIQSSKFSTRKWRKRALNAFNSWQILFKHTVQRILHCVIQVGIDDSHRLCEHFYYLFAFAQKFRTITGTYFLNNWFYNRLLE